MSDYENLKRFIVLECAYTRYIHSPYIPMTYYKPIQISNLFYDKEREHFFKRLLNKIIGI